MTPIPELRECPFKCEHGHITVFELYSKDNSIIHYYVECSSCHCRGPLSMDRNDAIKAWNIRFEPFPSWLRVQIEDYRKLMEYNSIMVVCALDEVLSMKQDKL